MLLALFLTLVMAVLPVQIWRCLSGKRKALKLIPLAAPLLCLGISAVLVLLVNTGVRPPDDVLVAAAMIMISLYLFGAIGMAWLIFGIVKLIQKRNK